MRLRREDATASPFGTLTYTYDGAGNISSLKSSNAGGASMTYGYDALNRLSSVTDVSGVTSYSYDAVGNLAGYTYPNGISTSYTYDMLNRLTNMQSSCGTATARENQAGENETSPLKWPEEKPRGRVDSTKGRSLPF